MIPSLLLLYPFILFASSCVEKRGANAFSIHSSWPRRRMTPLQKAMIFYGDGSHEESSSEPSSSGSLLEDLQEKSAPSIDDQLSNNFSEFDKQSFDADLGSLCSNDDEGLMESLSKKCTNSLSRLACAFAPTGHSIHLQDLQSAHLIDVDKRHIEIGAVLCEAGGCVQVAVPVTFPHSCDDGLINNIEECALENIQELDHMAYSIIQQEEQKADHYEESQQEEHIKLALSEEPSRREDFPSWWVFPSSFNAQDNMLEEECKMMKELLNKSDFSDAIQSLCISSVRGAGPEKMKVISAAAVAAVGPAGILLRGQVENSFDHLLEIPIAFAQGEVETAEDLRSAVLGLI